MPTLPALALVALGGAVGSATRYAVTHALRQSLGERWPWGTLAVNLAGCFLAGVLVTLLPKPESHALRLALITGFLGGLTTFSAFGAETYRLLDQGRALAALLNIAANVVAGLAAVGLGLALAATLRRVIP